MNTLLFGDRTDPAQGLGRLAQCLADNVEGLIPISTLDQIMPETEALVHTRRDPVLLPALIEHCQRTGQPLINLGTGFEVDLPPTLNFLYLECPNISLEVLNFMQRVQEACEAMETDFELQIIEHHQATKKDRSGTAQAMHNRAAALSLSQNDADYYRKNIVSVRDVNQTRKAGFCVPLKNEFGYAIHESSILAANNEQTFKPLEIYGRQTYAEGLAKVLETLQGLEPITGRLHITDFARRNSLI